MLPPIDELRAAIRAGTAILFAGTGLSAPAGYPTRRAQILRIVERPDFPSGGRHEIYEALRESSIDEVMELLLAIQGHDWVLDAFVEVMSAVHWNVLPPAYFSLARIPFRHVISTTVDDVAETAFSRRNPVVIDGADEREDSPQVSALFTGQRLVLAKLFGRLSNPRSIRLGSEELARYSHVYEYFPKMLASLLSSSTVFFAGVSIGAITGALEALRGVSEVLSRGSHVALLPGYAAQPRSSRRSLGASLRHTDHSRAG